MNKLMLQSLDKKYYPGIDTLKVFGLYLMILGHGRIVGQDMHNIIYSFHMPLFIMISGFLFKMRTPKETVVRSFLSLMVPYFIVNLICFVIGVILTSRNVITITYLLNTMVAIIAGLGYKYGDYNPVCTPMWFFYSLFIVQTVFSLFGCLKNKGLISLFIISFIMMYIIKTGSYDTLIPIDSAIFSMPFFVIGYWLKSNHHYLIETRRLIFISLTVMVVSSILAYHNGLVDLNKCLTGNNFILYIMIATAIPICLIMLALQSRNATMGGVKVLSSGAPVIVGFNLLVLSFLNHFRTDWYWNDFVGMLVAFVILLFFYPVIVLSRKYFPIILGYRKMK